MIRPVGEVLPKLNFIYATPISGIDRLFLRLLGRTPLRRSWDQLVWPKPTPAPLSITLHLCKALSTRFSVDLRDLAERSILPSDPNAILLGHPWPGRERIVARSLDSDFQLKILMAPYSHDPVQVGWLDPLLEKSDAFFAISSRFWQESMEHSPLRRHRNKFHFFEMGIELPDYPLIKKTFGAKGRRRFFYIGRQGQGKGLAHLNSVIKENALDGGFICSGGGIELWREISRPRALTPEFMADVATKYDFFINMSESDAQATTVLESIGWGFPVLCTAESGFTDPRLVVHLKLGDQEWNSRVIARMQSMDEEELIARAKLARSIVEARHSWKAFSDQLIQELVKLLSR